MTGSVVRAAAIDLACGYPGRTVLTRVDLEIKSGEVLALIGPNGSGKTTLFRTMAGELPPLAGRCLLDAGGEALAPVSTLSLRERARVVARVLQSELPSWPATVRDYVETGTFARSGWFSSPGRRGRASVDEAVLAAGLADFADRPVTELSGGEFRRVLIARALAQSPKVMLLDEPVADLDIARQMEVLGLLKSLAAAGAAVALSIHDLNLASLAADRVALLANGGLAAVGPPREVITAEAIASVYGASVVVGDHPLSDLPQVVHIPSWLEPGGGSGA